MQYASSKFVVSPKNKRRHFFSGKKLYDEIDKQEKNRYKQIQTHREYIGEEWKKSLNENLKCVMQCHMTNGQ